MVSAAPLLVPMVVKVLSTYSISVSHLFLKKGLIVLFDVVFLLLNACMVLGGMSHFPRHLEEAVLFGHLKNMGPVVVWALGGGATSGLTHIYWRIRTERSSHTSIYGRALLHADIHLLVWLFITFNFAWPLVSYFLPGHPPFETCFATRKTAMWVRGLTCVRNQWIWMVILPNRRADLSSPIKFRFCIHCIKIRIVRIHPPRSGAFPWRRRWNKIVCDFLEYPLHKTHYFTAWTNLTCK